MRRHATANKATSLFVWSEFIASLFPANPPPFSSSNSRKVENTGHANAPDTFELQVRASRGVALAVRRRRLSVRPRE
jgi:hypothetical protein